MSDVPHLQADVVPLLSAPTAERIASCFVDHWIGYARAMDILNLLDQTLEHPRAVRMPCVLVVGRSSNGKTSILERFTNRHPVLMTVNGTPITPIVRFDMADSPDEGEFWTDILLTLGMGHREKDPAAIKKRLAKRVLALNQTKMLVIDEFNNLINAGRGATELLAAIKGLSNELRISIVAAGTPEAVNALNSDPQMKSRFTPAILDRWALDKQYLRFLASYERLLPLAKPSNLVHPDLATTIYGMAGDTIGQTVKILRSAAALAITSGSERITPDILAHRDLLRKDLWTQVPELA